MSLFRQRMLRWALRRQGPDSLPLQLKPRRIYILPTGTGWTFGLLVVAMFLAGMNYGNGLALLLTRTRIGLIVRAALSQPEMLRALGHDVPRVFMGVFAGGCGLAGLAGVIGGNYFTTQPTLALHLGTIIFVVVVIGGLGSLAGALVASLLVGVVQTVSIGADVSLAPFIPVKLSEIGALLPYVLMVAVLIFRPKGLMGRRES